MITTVLGYGIAGTAGVWYAVELALVGLGKLTGRTYRVGPIWHS